MKVAFAISHAGKLKTRGSRVNQALLCLHYPKAFVLLTKVCQNDVLTSFGLKS